MRDNLSRRIARHKLYRQLLRRRRARPLSSMPESGSLEDYELLEAVHLDDVEKAVRLLDAGADVHIGNDLPLKMAVENGNPIMVQELVRSGADVGSLSEWDIEKAYRMGYKDVLEVLSDAGLNLDLVEDWAMGEEFGYGLHSASKSQRNARRHRVKTLAMLLREDRFNK